MILAISVLLAIGVFVITLAKAPEKLLRIGLLIWLIVYLTYMWLLQKTGRMVVLQGFGRIIDLPYLSLMAAYAAVLLRLQLNAISTTDVFGFPIGFVLVGISFLVSFYQGPAGAPIGSWAESLSFTLHIPGYTLMALSVICLSVNSLRWIWWEITGKTPEFERQL